MSTHETELATILVREFLGPTNAVNSSLPLLPAKTFSNSIEID